MEEKKEGDVKQMIFGEEKEKLLRQEDLPKTEITFSSLATGLINKEDTLEMKSMQNEM